MKSHRLSIAFPQRLTACGCGGSARCVRQEHRTRQLQFSVAQKEALQRSNVKLNATVQTASLGHDTWQDNTTELRIRADVKIIILHAHLRPFTGNPNGQPLAMRHLRLRSGSSPLLLLTHLSWSGGLHRSRSRTLSGGRGRVYRRRSGSRTPSRYTTWQPA